METEFWTVVVPCIISLLGGGGLTWLFTIRWTRKQEENNATKTSQEIYQSIITDLNSDRSRLVEEKVHLRAELSETRAELSETRAALSETQTHLNRLDKRSNIVEGQLQLVNRKLNAVLPLTCADAPTCERKKELTKQDLWVGKEPAAADVAEKVDSIHDATGEDYEEEDP